MLIKPYIFTKTRFHTLGREERAARVADGNVRDDRARRRKHEKEEALKARMMEQSKVIIFSLRLTDFFKSFPNESSPWWSREARKKTNGSCLLGKKPFRYANNEKQHELPSYLLLTREGKKKTITAWR